MGKTDDRLSPMTLGIILLNVFSFLIEAANPEALIDVFALWPPVAQTGGPSFHAWQLFTYSALHANLSHLALNMFGLFMFGRDIERAMGGARLAVLYFVSVLTGALTQIGVAALAVGPAAPTIGASAGVFGVLVAYALIYPQRPVVLLFPPIPMPAWLFACAYALIELTLGVSGRESGVAHFAHLGGMIGAIALMLHWSRMPRQRRG